MLLILYRTASLINQLKCLNIGMTFVGIVGNEMSCNGLGVALIGPLVIYIFFYLILVFNIY